MGIFGRSKKNQTEESVEETGPVTLEGEPGVDRDWDRTFDGPYDVSERPEVKGRVDLGALRVPAVPGMEMRLDVDKGTSSITGLTCSIQGSKLQIQVFAAPRTEGLWDDIRKGLAESVQAADGTATIDSGGVMGKELLTQLPVKDADGHRTGATVTNRFIGVDGPRWFLRAVVNGPAATEGRQLDVVRKFLRQVVVDRGTEPRPPREVLALTAPKGVVEEATRRRTAARAAAAAKRAGAGVSGAAAAGSAAAGSAAAGAAAAGSATTAAAPAEGASPEQDGTGSES